MNMGDYVGIPDGYELVKNPKDATHVIWQPGQEPQKLPCAYPRSLSLRWIREWQIPVSEEIPERIWATDELHKWYRCNHQTGDTEFVRADLYDTVTAERDTAKESIKELVEKLEDSQRCLIEYSSVLGLVESTCKPNGLPYEIKKVKIAGDLQLIHNNPTLARAKELLK